MTVPLPNKPEFSPNGSQPPHLPERYVRVGVGSWKPLSEVVDRVVEHLKDRLIADDEPPPTTKNTAPHVKAHFIRLSKDRATIRKGRKLCL